MTTHDLPAPAAARRPLGALLNPFRRWCGRTRTRKTLREMDARLLADIGLTPKEAAILAGKPFRRG